MPRSDTYATSQAGANSILTRLIYTVFMMLPDSTVITVLEGAAFLSRAHLAISIMLVGIVVGAGYLLFLYAASSKKTLHYLVIPYALFTVFAALVYFCAHHMGMLLAFVIFWLWIALEDEDRFAAWKKMTAKVTLQEHDRKTLQFAGKFALAIIMLMPVYWTVGASFLEITTPYYYGREMAKFLKDTGLWQLNVMAEYDISVPSDVLDTDYDIMDYVNTEIVARPVAVLPYFEHNFCKNLNMGRDEAGYVLHIVPSKEENEKALAEWKKMGAPDVIIHETNLKLIFGDEVNLSDYVAVYEYAPYANIWKAFPSKYNIAYKGFIYVRKDLIEKYGLQPIQLGVIQ